MGGGLFIRFTMNAMYDIKPHGVYEILTSLIDPITYYYRILSFKLNQYIITTCY